MQLSRSFGPVRSLLPRFLVVHELLPRERELICVGNCVSCDRGKVLSQTGHRYRLNLVQGSVIPWLPQPCP